jgi:methylmalonyl-CoA carboxyltransferase large subunit
MSVQERIERLRQTRARLRQCGGEARIAKQRAAGKMTARERLGQLFDPETSQELFLYARHRCTSFGMEGKELPAEGVVCMAGAVEGRQIFAASQDFTVAGGTVGEMHADKICQMMDLSLKCGAPFVFLNDSGGARIQEGIDALSGYGRIFFRNVQLSGVVPQIAIVAGPCAGGAAYSPALTDFIIMVQKTGRLFITGPQVIKEVTGEEISDEELGGVQAQMNYSGVVHFVASDDAHALAICKKLLSFLPANNTEDPPDVGDGSLTFAYDLVLDKVIPDDPRNPYDVREVIRRVVDAGDFLEVQEHFAANVVVGLARINGRTVGIMANQPNVMGGCLDIDASDKLAKMVRFCNAFNIPIVTFVDVPGFLPGIRQEYGGIIRHGAKILFAYSAATVPKITIILRKAYGGAYLAMSGKELGADRVAAWPTAEIAVMGAEGAVNVIHREALKKAENPQETKQRFVEEYRETFASPFLGAGRNLIDDVIEPGDTRRYISLALESLRTKRETRPQKKHGLIPL